MNRRRFLGAAAALSTLPDLGRSYEASVARAQRQQIIEVMRIKWRGEWIWWDVESVAANAELGLDVTRKRIAEMVERGVIKAEPFEYDGTPMYRLRLSVRVR